MRAAMLFFCSFALVCRADEPLAGKWSGKVQVPGRELTLIVDLVRDATDSPGRAQDKQNWIGSATLPGLNIKGAPVTDIAAQNGEIAFVIQAMAGPGVEPPRIKARVVDEKLNGEFLQGGNSAPIVLEKIGPAQVEQPPRNTAIAKEFEGEWRGEYELLGLQRKVTLKLQGHGADAGTAELVIVGRKVNNVPIDRIAQQNEFITMESAAFGMTYEGRLTGNDEIKGQLLQGPLEIALTLRRAK